MSDEQVIVRRPAVAGLFYPAAPDALREAIHQAFAAARPASPGVPVPKAIVVPHAGYPYSGAIAASGYLRVEAARSTIRRVVLLGPSHRVYVRGLALPSALDFETPLGMIPVDGPLRDQLAALHSVTIDDVAHAMEHSLEVQLPFLQTVLDDFTLLPLSVGDATTEEVASVLRSCWGGPETLIVVSTDLSHGHPDDEARVLDAQTAAAVVARRPGAIRDEDACGSRPLRGLLHVAGAIGLTVEQVDLGNSGDTAGDRERVVGYGAFALA